MPIMTPASYRFWEAGLVLRTLFLFRSLEADTPVVLARIPGSEAGIGPIKPVARKRVRRSVDGGGRALPKLGK
jgi:hypothetical protein